MLYPVHGLGPGPCQASIGGPRQDRVTTFGRLAEGKQKEEKLKRPIRMPIPLGVGSLFGAGLVLVRSTIDALAQASW